MRNRVLWCAAIIALILGVLVAWRQHEVREAVVERLKEDLRFAEQMNRLAGDRLASADIAIRRMQNRIDGLEGEVRRRVSKAVGRVRDLDAFGIARELDRFSVGSETEGVDAD